MDIKLKSNEVKHHKMGILLILIVLALASGIMTGLYPFFQREADRHKEQPYGNGMPLQNEIYNCTWYLYSSYEMGRQEGARSAFDVLVKTEQLDSVPRPEEAEELSADNYSELLRIYREDNDSIRRTLEIEYERWQRAWLSLRETMEYEVTDQAEQVLMKNGEKPLLSSIEADDMADYAFYVVIHFDENGIPSIRKIHGVDSGSLFASYTSMMSRSLEQTVAELPESSELNIRAAYRLPQNMNFIYAMSQESYEQYLLAERGDTRGYYTAGTVATAYMILAAFVGLAALLLPAAESLGIGNEKIFRTPMELALIALVCVIPAGVEAGILLAAGTSSGSYVSWTAGMGFGNSAAMAVTAANFAVWFLFFAIIYWCVTCLRGIWTMGPVAYLRQRSLICRFWRQIWGFLKKCWHKIYHMLLHVDLKNEATKSMIKIVGVNFLLLTVICCMWFFGIFALVVYSVILFFILNKFLGDIRMRYDILLKGVNRIAEGNLDVEIKEDLGVFEPFKEELVKIQSGFKVAVEEEVKSQRMKTELITNVSHDLKTPLTAIITYVNLLKEDGITEEQRDSYISVLEKKSMRLKYLIEDLFEVSKANSNNVTLDYVDVDIVNLFRQTQTELSDKIEESSLIFRCSLPKEKVILRLDSQKTYRIFENLLNNILKYAMPGTRVYIDIEKHDTCVTIVMKNISGMELTLNGMEITERFVRGDEARNTEGSGLGLAIVKSFTEVQGGSMDVDIDGDLFKVMLQFPLAEKC